MINFIDTAHCLLRVHCEACRQNPVVRQRIAARFAVPDDFAVKCPFDPPGVVWPVANLEKKEAKAVQTEAIPAKENPPSGGTLVTVSVTGFTGDHAPNGTWTIQAPNPDGFVSGVLVIKLIQEGQSWNLAIFRKCCGNRQTPCATGKAVSLGQPFEVIGENSFKNQKGIGSLV